MIYAAFLRGINVGGKNKIEMDSLREIFSAAGCRSPRTYLNSGNVIFEADSFGRLRLEENIKSIIKEQLDLDIDIIIRGKTEVEAIVSSNPYGGRENNYTVLLQTESRQQITADIEKVKAEDDEYLIKMSEIHLCIPGGFGKTKLTNGFFEKKLKVAATTRNIKTIMKILSMMNENE